VSAKPAASRAVSRPALRRRPRLGFAGVGWIGGNRLAEVARRGAAEIAALADPSAESLAAARPHAAEAEEVSRFEDLLERDLDGIVLATPSAMHAEQCAAALDRGVAVFCQKPLGRNLVETLQAVRAAKRADRLLGVDFSYRGATAARRVAEIVRAGAIGRVYAAELVFHNAFGPDKAWFYDPLRSGGGCLIDLGIHLVDLALWTLDYPRVAEVTGRLYAKGSRFRAGAGVEDYASATLDLEDGASVRVACSWKLHAGRDAVISAAFYGERGGAAFSNVDGSFYDLAAELRRGTRREVLAEPPDPWGGRAILDWVDRLAAGGRYDPEVERAVDVAAVIQRIYDRCAS
jgi:predicted dehydrogenase